MERPGHATRYEMRLSKAARDLYGLSGNAFAASGDVVFGDWKDARELAAAIRRAGAPGATEVKAGALFAMALLHEIAHALCAQYRRRVRPEAMAEALEAARARVGAGAEASLAAFTRLFPPGAVFAGDLSPEEWLGEDRLARACETLEELLLLRLAAENPAMAPYRFLFDATGLRSSSPADATLDAAEALLASLPPFDASGERLPSLLRAAARACPHSLGGQLDYARRRWGDLLGERIRSLLLGASAMMAEEERRAFPPGPGPVRVASYAGLDAEYERFSADKDWMPRVVMIAKSALVWLDQLSKAYGREIRTLDAIPDEELDLLARRGLNALWLIGIWERSGASRRIKELCGNPEAAASAYSLYDYEIAGELGGWAALENLRGRAWERGIRLAADMVPNHTGLDSAWVRERPDLFVSRAEPPFPSYGYTGENLSADGRVGLWIEDHYYDRRDAAVTFKRVDFRTGETRYVYHGNDGTSMPWNDTAQIDFLKAEAREAVKERILHVARNFPIIRFDAAMVLAKRSFRRLWYPEPGAGDAIASRFESAMDAADFNERIPNEFWREVVDLCASEAPDTLLLAEAFWMMEGYFVRTLGMHRVYNSAFMNMLKAKKNAEYRATVRNTIEFDKDILKRFVNFMNNPDEDTALAQFGTGDHYFGVCSMMATMPGLPMFGHGQFEGFSEKYGMEYRRAYLDEKPNEDLLARHEREIVPLLKRRHLFSGVDLFLFYDLVRHDGSVDENVFAYSNGYGDERALVFYNNAWERTSGRVRRSCPYTDKRADGLLPGVTRGLAEGLGLRGGPRRLAVMTEARSGLRYLRRSDELARDGLSVALEGFQCQVFLDIREIEDDDSGSYAALEARLGGSGVPDLAAALQDMTLEGLYAAWNQAFGPAFFADRVCAMAQGGAAGNAGGGTAEAGWSLDEVALGRLVREAERTAGLQAASSASSASSAATVPAMTDCAAALHTALAALEEATVGAALAATPEAGLAYASLLSLVPLAYAAAPSAEPAYGEAEAQAKAWGFERKLREALAAAGVEAGEAERAAGFAVAALGRLREERAQPGVTLRRAPAAVAAMIATDDEARALLGVNEWHGEAWIRAERLALATALGLAARVGFGGAAPKAAANFAKALMDAAAEADWSLDRLLAGAKATKRPKTKGKKER